MVDAYDCKKIEKLMLLFMNRVLNTDFELWKHKIPNKATFRATQDCDLVFSRLTLGDSDHFITNGTIHSLDGVITVKLDDDFIDGISNILNRLKLPVKRDDPAFTLRKVWYRDLIVWDCDRHQIVTIPNMDGKCNIMCRVVPFILRKGSRCVFDITVKQIQILDELYDPNAPYFQIVVDSL
jgi:hypothetical protein